jgi:hypothetical protein
MVNVRLVEHDSMLSQALMLQQQGCGMDMLLQVLLLWQRAMNQTGLCLAWPVPYTYFHCIEGAGNHSLQCS